MLSVCVVDVMDLVFYVCIVRRGAVCARSVSVSSCRCCMLGSCVYPVAVFNATFCMTCRLLMLVEDERDDHMKEAYSRGGLITDLYVAMRVSFCLLHPVAVSAFMIYRGLCACTDMLWMCVLYVSFGSVTMASALLCIFRSRLLVYSAGYGVNRVQVVLSGFSMRLFCFVQKHYVGMVVTCIYLLVALVLVCVDVMVMSSA